MAKVEALALQIAAVQHKNVDAEKQYVVTNHCAKNTRIEEYLRWVVNGNDTLDNRST
jgi:hypothetical protein